MKDFHFIKRVAITVMVLCLFLAGSVQAEILSKPWRTFSKEEPISRLYPAFPDIASRYDMFMFRQHSGDFDILKITGRFPYARYFSFNVYDHSEATDLMALADIEIIPDAGHINPFIPGNNREAENRSFTLYLIKEGVAVPPEAEIVVVLPHDIDVLSLFVRVYRPDKGYDSFGGVAQPVIEALKADLSSGTSPEYGMKLENILNMIPLFVLNEEFIETWNISRQFAGNNVTFYRTSEAGLFPNAHNEYILASLPQDYINKVAVITFTPPTVEDTYKGGEFTGSTDVRYWSFCTGGLGLTATADCLCDDQVKKNPDGTATIIIAPLYLKNSIEAKGFNFMKWEFLYKPLIIHRHMLAAEDFEGRIGNVPAVSRPPAPEDRNEVFYNEHKAQNFMGKYAPTGKVYNNIANFLLWLRKQ